MILALTIKGFPIDAFTVAWIPNTRSPTKLSEGDERWPVAVQEVMHSKTIGTLTCREHIGMVMNTPTIGESVVHIVRD